MPDPLIRQSLAVAVPFGKEPLTHARSSSEGRAGSKPAARLLAQRTKLTYYESRDAWASISRFISRTASRMPTKSERETIECPMLNSPNPGIAAMGPMLR